MANDGFDSGATFKVIVLHDLKCSGPRISGSLRFFMNFFITGEFRVVVFGHIEVGEEDLMCQKEF